MVATMDGEVLAGHTRIKSAALLGETAVPVVRVDLTPDEARAYRLADNKVGEHAKWIDELLAQEAELLDSSGMDLSVFGFDTSALKDLLSPVPDMGDISEETDAKGARRGRARSCHGCPMDGLGLPVCWAACPGPRTDFTTDGQSMVALGAMVGQDGADAFIESRTARDARLARLPRTDFVTGLPPETETALLKLLRIFADMTEREVLTLHAMLNGENQSGAARHRGVSKQAASKTVIRLAARHPELAPFFRRGAS